MTLRERDLPVGELSARYGVGNRCRPERRSLAAWRAQLAAWGFRRDQAAHAERLWQITANAHSGDATRAALPSGRILQAYSPGKHRALAHPGRVIPGPDFWLSFHAARALWRDTHIDIQPTCERITVGAS